MRTKPKRAVRLRILPLEEFAGESDSPHNRDLAEAEDKTLAKETGGFGTFATWHESTEPWEKYEEEELESFWREVKKIK